MKDKKTFSHLALPGVLWFLLFLTFPIVIIILFSFLQKGPYGGVQWTFQLENYFRSFEGIYLKIFFSSFNLALLNAIICLFLGFPIAYVMATASLKIRNLFVYMLALPMLMNLVIRIYAIRVLVAYDGPILSFLQFLGVETNPFAFSHNMYLVFYGMVSSYLPFMVFPIYVAFEKFDFYLIEAAQDLGARPWTIIFKIIIPNLKVAITNGLLLVFIPSLGEFVIPDLLGGAKTMLVGNLITEQFLKARDWPFGSALSVLLMIMVGLCMGLVNRLQGKMRSKNA